MAKAEQWAIGDVLYMSGEGCYPTMFVAERLAGSLPFGGCYSPHDKITRKASLEDADRLIEVQERAVERETAWLEKLVVLREVIRAAAVK